MIRQIFTPWRWAELIASWREFADAFATTLLVAFFALLLALALGAVFGVMSSSRNKLLRVCSRIYVEFFQNTPLAIQVFFVYYALPYAGIVLYEVPIGIICVGLYTGAYISEVVRAGIESISKGQSEAASSQGFTYVQTMIEIIIPQTVRIILPPLINQCVNLIKNTSILAMIAGGDLMYRSNAWATNGHFSYGPSYFVCGVLYFVLCFPLTRWARSYEMKLKERNTVKDADKDKTNSWGAEKYE